jgi:hypothetical protein
MKDANYNYRANRHERARPARKSRLRVRESGFGR